MSEKMGEWGWMLALAMVALPFMLPFTGDPYQMPRLALLAILCVPLLLRRSYHRSNLEFEILAALLAWCVAACFTKDIGYTLVGSFLAPFDCATAVFVYAGLAIGVARLGLDAEGAGACIIIASVPLSLYALVQRMLLNRDPFLAAPLPGLTRVVASQGFPPYLGSALAISAAVMMALLKQERGAKRFIQSALALAIAGIWVSGTRGALLALVAAAFVLVDDRRKWLALAAAPLVLLARRGALRSDIGRVEDYKMAVRVFLSHPIVGIGVSTYTAVVRQYLTPVYVHANHNAMVAPQHAHSQVLQVAAETGLVGMAAYAMLVSAMWRVAKFSKDRAILIAAGAAYLVLSNLNPIPLSVTVLMILLFAAASSRPAEVRGVITPMALALGCAASAFLCCRIVAANFLMEHAGRHREDRPLVLRDVDMAAKLNPWEIRIASAQMDVHITAEKKVTHETVEIAHRELLKHLNDSSAYEVYGRLVVLGASQGIEDPREAAMAFDIAQKLAPTFKPLMIRRRALAAMMGERAKAMAINDDINRIEKLEAL